MSKFATKKRTEIGSNRVSKLRAEGYIPGVAYGSHSKTYEISIPKNEFERFLKHYEVGAKVSIKVGRGYEDAVLKEIQRDPLTGKVIHADFQLLKAGEAIHLRIPIHFLGKESVEDKFTSVMEMAHEVEIVALPKDLIDHVEVDLTGMEVGDSILVADLAQKLGETITITDEPDKMVVSVTGKAVSEASEDSEETETESEETPLEVL